MHFAKGVDFVADVVELWPYNHYLSVIRLPVTVNQKFPGVVLVIL